MNYTGLIFLLVFFILGLVANKFTRNVFYYLDELDSQDQEEDQD